MNHPIAIFLGILLLAACASAAEREAQAPASAASPADPTCTAVFLDGQEGKEIGRRTFEVQPESIGESTPVDACLAMAGQRPMERTLVIKCDCE